MSQVYLLWFEREGIESGEAGILAGVYSTEEAAQAAIQRLRDKPGFVDRPQGFEIAAYELDRVCWSEGFKFDVD